MTHPISSINQSKQLHVRRGDLVIVRSGDDRGQRGRVLAVAARTGRVTVEGVSLVTRHVRPSAKRTQVGRVQQPAALAAANVQLICPHCSQPTKRVVSVVGTTRNVTCRQCHESVVPIKGQS